jgi:hypothetical protein
MISFSQGAALPHFKLLPKTYKNLQFNNLWPERKIKSPHGSIKFTSADKYLAWVLGRKGLFIGFLQQPSSI